MATVETKIADLPESSAIRDTDLFILLLANTNKLTYSALKTKIFSETTITSLTSDVASLKTTVGNTSSGLVKNVTTLLTTVGDSTTGLVKNVTDLLTAVGNADSGLVKNVTTLLTTVGNADSGLVKDTNTISTNVFINTDSLSARIYSLELTSQAGISPASNDKLGGFKTGFLKLTADNDVYYPIELSTTVGSEDLPDNDPNKYKAYVKIPNTDTTTIVAKVNYLVEMSSAYAIADNDSIKYIPHINSGNITTISNDLYGTTNIIGIVELLSALAEFEKTDGKLELVDGIVDTQRILLQNTAAYNILEPEPPTDPEEPEGEVSIILSGGIVYDLSATLSSTILSVDSLSVTVSSTILSVDSLCSYLENVDSNISAKFLNIFYPISSIYYSANSTAEPSALFGGSWEYMNTVLSDNGISAWKRTS